MNIRRDLTSPTSHRIRHWSLALGMALLLATWTVLFAQLVGGHVAATTHAGGPPRHAARVAVTIIPDAGQATAYRS